MKTATKRRWQGRLRRPPRWSAPAKGADQHVRRRCSTDGYSLVKGRTPGSSHFYQILRLTVEGQFPVFDLIQGEDPTLDRHLTQLMGIHRVIVPTFRARIK